MLYLFKKGSFSHSLKFSLILTITGFVVFLLSIFLFFIYAFLAIEKYNNYEFRLLDVFFVFIFSIFSILLMLLFYKIRIPEKIKKTTNNEKLSYEENMSLIPYICLYYWFCLNLLILILINYK